MHELMAELEKIKFSKKTLMDWLECELSAGMGNADGKELGAATDMIKDLAEAAEKCVKAKYYEDLIHYMHDNEEDDSEVYGYDPYRYASGRFAPKGRGHRTGYHWPPYVNPRLPWPMTGHAEHDAEGMFEVGMEKMGYPMTDLYHDFGDKNPANIDRMYHDYKLAKKHYTETKSDGDHRHMNDKIEEGVLDTMDILTEMWEDASPELKKKLKPTVMKLFENVAKA